jgi:hypothetical protein
MHIITVYKAFNKNNFQLKFRTKIISDNADAINHKISFKPIDNVPCNISPQFISFQYIIKIKKGLKFDSGPTLFANFGLHDNKYRFESYQNQLNDTVSLNHTKVVKEGNQNVIRPTVGYLFNIYVRNAKDVKFGFNLGLSTNDIKRINYHLGGSLLLGQSQRIGISCGLTVGQVNFVVDEYDPEKIMSSNGIMGVIEQPRTDLPEEVPLLSSPPFKLGGYIGFTFNLTGAQNTSRVTEILR